MKAFVNWLRANLFRYKHEHVWETRLCDFRLVDGKKQFRKERTCQLCLVTETTDWE